MNFVPILFLLITAALVKPQNVQKEIHNIFNMLSMLGITPDSFIKIATETNETQCNKDIITILTDASEKEINALKMLDASAKIPDSIFDSNRLVYGSFDECMNLKIAHNFQPQYCLLSINITRLRVISRIQPFRYPKASYGICVPSTCSPQYISRILQNIQFPYWGKNLSQEIQVRIEDGDCMRPNDVNNVTLLNWTTFIFIALIILLVIASTIYEIFHSNAKLSIYTSFSILTTGRNIFAADPSGLTGLRAVLAFIVIYGHYAVQIVHGNLKNIPFCKTYDSTVSITTSVHGIHGFIMMAGLFSVLSFYNEVSKKKSYDPVMATLKRYLKIMFPSVILYLMRRDVIQHLHRGPVYNTFNLHQAQLCPNFYSLLPILLAYKNVAAPKFTEACLPYLWYNCLDIQLFAFTQILFLIEICKPKLLFKLSFLFCLLCDLRIIYVSYIHDLGYTVGMTSGTGHFDYVYSLPHTRGVSWFAGMLWAGVILKNRKTNFDEYKGLFKLMWIVALLCLIYAFGKLYNAEYGVYSQPEAAIYGGLHYIAITIAVGWIVFTLFNKIAGPLQVLLSWGPFTLLGQLSFEFYLIQITVMEFVFATSRNTIFLTYNRFCYHVIAMIGCSTLAALGFALLFTRPFSNLVALATKDRSILRIPFQVTEETETNDHDKKV